MVFDPIKRATAYIQVNPLGAIAGGVAGVMLVRRYTPMRGWVGLTVAVLGGALGGAFAQSKIKAMVGSQKSANQAKK
jgi:outer membrane lipoprotein SlyB